MRHKYNVALFCLCPHCPQDGGAHGENSPQGGKWGGTPYMYFTRVKVSEKEAVNRQEKNLFLKNKLRITFSIQFIKSPELPHQTNETSLPLSDTHFSSFLVILFLAMQTEQG